MNENQPQNFDNTDLDRLHAAVKREKPDAQPGREPAPLWVFVASMAAMVLAGGYAGAYVGGFDFEQNSPYLGKVTDTRPIKIDVADTLDPFALAMKKGADSYNSCQGCHGATGGGQPGLIPPLAGSEWVAGGTERIARIALHGLSGSVTVKGANYNGVMPPQSGLSDKELSYVITYIRNSWGNKGSLVTPDMVKKVRAETKAHLGPWTAATLSEFAEKDIPGEAPAAAAATPAAAPAAK
ncbi:cytochrome c [Verrucomicrobium sp. BvORR034]|uniref:c-type cytochrome n=1 Tax=Verrucomicrobium sp. BvORR034 TaxID=1396418 RepID=UPI00067868E2|nr:cytochrome c [Verrucomicrobium sp. BvORR034]